VSAATGLVGHSRAGRRDEIAKLIKKHLGVGSETVEGLMPRRGDDDGLELLDEIETDGSELSEMAQEASVVRLVNEILLEAIETRASDVHIESQPDGLVIRYRIDGMLQPQPVPPEINRFQAAIISRLKIMARLNIAEKRLPQDGRIKLKVQGPRDRRPRVGDPDDPRRRDRHAYSRQGAMKFRAARLGMEKTPTARSAN
jgi:general secretion pathway protein E